MLCNVTRAKRVILGLVAVFVVINLHFLWTAGLQWESSKTGEPHNARCDSSQGHEVLVVVVWPWVDALLYGFGPFLIISVLNIIIIRRLTSDSNMRLTVMLLTVSFAFLLTTLPMNVSIIGAAFWNRDADNIPVMVRVKLVSTVAELLMYLNHSVNFFLYCATGQKFRNEVVRMVCGKQRPNALLADHSQHLYCSRMCVASYVEIRRSTDETEL
nr:hypothetical protein BaRGS_014068 [Batillaria attramentaria]